MEINQLISLFKAEKYDQVIANTNDSKDMDELFLRAISFGLTHQFDKAISCIKDNEKILAKDFKRLIDTHIQICYWENDLIAAKNALDHYEEYPYVSQEIEETFIHYKTDIEKRIKNMGKSLYSEDDLIAYLKSDNIEKNQLALEHIKRYDLAPFIDTILDVLVSKKEQATRCLALVLLFDKHYAKPVKYNWHGQILEVVPAKLKTPLQDEVFQKLLKRSKEAKDVIFEQTFQTLLATYYLDQFPNPVLDKEDDLYIATEIVTRRYIGWPENKMRQSPAVEKLILKIKDCNEQF